MHRIRVYLVVTAVALAGLFTVGTSGASGCTKDCGVSPDDTPADVANRAANVPLKSFHFCNANGEACVTVQ